MKIEQLHYKLKKNNCFNVSRISPDIHNSKVTKRNYYSQQQCCQDETTTQPPRSASHYKVLENMPDEKIR